MRGRLGQGRLGWIRGCFVLDKGAKGLDLVAELLDLRAEPFEFCLGIRFDFGFGIGVIEFGMGQGLGRKGCQ